MIKSWCDQAEPRLFALHFVSMDVKRTEIKSTYSLVCCCCSDAKSCLTLCNQGTAAQQAPLSSLSPRICSDSCPLSQWCYLTISPSATPFPLCLQSFPASWSFPVSQLFASGGQSIIACEVSEVKVAQSCPTLCDPWTIQPMEFSRPEYWSG